MSYEDIRVSEIEVCNMRNAVNQADAYVIRQHEEEERIKEQTALLAAKLEAVRAANRTAIDSAVSYLDSVYVDSVNFLDKTGAKVKKQETDFYNQVAELRSSMSKLGTKLSHVGNMADKLASQYNNVFQNIAATAAGVQARCNMTVGQINSLLERVNELHPERFAATASKYGIIASKTDLINANNLAGDYDAALALSQTMVSELSGLLLRLIPLNEQYNLRQYQVGESLSALKERINRLAAKEGVLECGDTTLDYDISYWSFGSFDELVTEVVGLETALNNNSMLLSALEQAEERIKELDDELSSCDEKARRERVNYYEVSNMVQQLYSTLEEQDWELKSAEFNDNNKTNPYVMELTRAGEKISIIVSPPDSTNNASYTYEAYSDSKAKADIIKNDVRASIAASGMKIETASRSTVCYSNETSNEFVNDTMGVIKDRINKRRMTN